MIQVLLNGFSVGMTYALVALGLTLIFSIMNIVNFAHGQLYMIGGFIVYYVYNVYKLPLFLGLGAAALGVGILGVVLESVFFQPVLRRIKREEAVMLLAMGLALLLENLAFLVFGEKQRGVPAVVSGVFEWGGAFLPAGRALVMGLAFVLIVGLIVLINTTRTGRALRAMAQDREAAMLQGVNVKQMSALGFGLGSALAGVAGGLMITVLAIDPGAGTPVSIRAFMMIMIGGAGVVSGAIVGAFVLGFAESIGYALLPGSLNYLVIFVGLIAFLIWRPQGMMGKPGG